MRLHEIWVGTARGLRAAWLPVLLAVIGLFPAYTKNTFMGDIGDSRFNMYVLEHGYQALVRRTTAFWDAPFFYPHQNVLAYSDHHLGSLPLYAAVRPIANMRERAFQYWELATLALTFFSGYLALRSFGAGRLAAALAAYVFAFGLPMRAQAEHSQLLPRYLLPWVFVCASRWAERGRTRDFACVAALMVGQMYLGVYCGLLSGVVLAGYLLALCFLDPEPRAVLRHLVGPGRALIARGALALLAMASLLPVAVPYWRASKELGARAWRDIAPLLPRLNSWLFPPPESTAWGWLGNSALFRFSELPFPNEHHLFAGLAVLIPVLAWPWLRLPETRLARQANAAWWSAAFCFALTLFAWNGSLWSLLAGLPGLGALRAVTRIEFYLFFPLAMVLAAALDGLAGWAGPRLARARPGAAAGAACLLVLAVVVDQSVVQVKKTSFADSMAGVKPIEAALKAQGKPKVFWVCQGGTDVDWITNLDAMLAAQDLGLRTLNGYSGWAPPSYGLAPFKKAAAQPYDFTALKAWLAHEKELSAGLRLLVVDQRGRVDWSAPPRDYALGAPLIFSKGNCEWCLERGFCGAETDGVWTVEPTAALVLRVPALPGRDLALVIQASTSPLQPGAHNTYGVKVNGTPLGSRRVDAPGDFEWTLAIPAAAAKSAGGLLHIELETERLVPVRQSDPKSKDNRRLGLFLQSLRVE